MEIATQTPNYFETYTLDLSDLAKNEGMVMASVHRVLSCKGSAAGFFAEDLITSHLSEHLIHSPAKGYDAVSRKRGTKVEIKSFTKGGVKLCESKDIGAGRKVNLPEFFSYVATKDFIIADTTLIADGRMEYVIVPGSFIGNDIQDYKVTFRNKPRLFASEQKSQPVVW